MKLQDIQSLMKSFESSDITKMEISEKDFSLKLEKDQRPTLEISKTQSNQVEEQEHQEEGLWVTSPLVGTFYESRSEDGKPFIEVGQSIKKGDVLCIIEAMKVMNEIRAPKDGVIQSIHVTNASMVEFDQKLIKIGDEL